MDEVTRAIEEVVRQNSSLFWPCAISVFLVSVIFVRPVLRFRRMKNYVTSLRTSSTKSRGKLYLAMYTMRNIYFLKFYINEERYLLLISVKIELLFGIAMASETVFSKLTVL